jgi:acyl-CoA synthetase (AMP-forming)/AMP-acid ligase II
VTGPGWEAHLPADVRAQDVDLTARRTLPEAWKAVWAKAPSAPVLFEPSAGWISAAALEDATRVVAGRFQAAGLDPGDLGRLDSDGYLRILGRTKELIITGGLNVYPREVEEVVQSHPDVTEVAVVGTPSDEWGEVVTAFVVSAAERPSADALIEFAAERLAPFKRPRRVQFVDALPRNALGKVVKRELIAPARR